MSQPAHLLSLATLHTAAPGVLDVVFGPDGDFERAPHFTGPLSVDGRFVGGLPTMKIRMGGQWQPTHLVCAPFDGDDAGILWAYPLARVYLDLRIPSVAARLAGLCARALGIAGETPAALCWSLDPTGRGRWMLARVGDRKHGPCLAAWDGFGLPIRCYDEQDAPLPPPVAVPFTADALAFRRALTLTLAPRIAALRTTASPR